MLIVALMGLVTLSALAATYPAWDINQDGVVNMRDVNIECMAFGSFVGSANWNPACDINPVYAPIYDDTGKIIGYDYKTILGYGDGRVDMRDINWVVMHFGKVYK